MLDHLPPRSRVISFIPRNACKSGWFLLKDTNELINLTDEIGRSFCNPVDIDIEPNNPPHVIPKIMSRFYPRMKMGRVLASLEVKPEFGAYVVDFQILKNTVSEAQEKIRLFVAQTDNILSSSCIISPPQVNFLINGKAVEKRTNVVMDNGPQLPTNITSILKYGTNLLQAVGHFNGCYIIAIAFMSMVSSSDIPMLQDYVQPVSTALDSDSEIIEGPSRISLNCPISFRRIKTPAKGHLCKHLQCFDYENFIQINSRRPSWRCPHCNQSVCYPDIRIDQSMLNVLKEVGENVVDVIISADGSWKPILESNGHANHLHEKIVSHGQEAPDPCESTEFSNSPANIVDLTFDETDEIDAMATSETVDRKPFQNIFHDCSVVRNSISPEMANNTSEVAQNDSHHIEDDFWAGVMFRSPSETLSTNCMQTPLHHPDAVSATLHRQPIISLPQSQVSASNNLQLQPSHYRNPIIDSETGRISIPRNITRTPIAVQALPAQPLVPTSNQRSRMTNGFPSVLSHTSMEPITNNFIGIGEMERQQQVPGSLMNPASDMGSFSMQHHSMTQNWDYQNLSYMSSHQPYQQQIVGLTAPNQLPSSYRVSPGLPPERQHPAHQQRQHPTTRPTHFPMSQAQQGPISVASLRQSAALRASQGSRTASAVPVQHQTSRTTGFSPSTSDGLRMPVSEHLQRGGSADFGSEQNWRPTGRMRGSLSGHAYSAALSQFMIQPLQQDQADMPMPQQPLGVSTSQLQANNINSQAAAPAQQTYSGT
ncbi:hypothetical protein GIB67_033951 [Kingdonia uniflora]|uniref:SP-RING-type domain-containing protein n=1 Tax=Kingdonia uniflora TaxID=39325 RepID=A0A7J7L6N5_9MAGN|nr:hypothetical protein GIB67_033951 [Kingdonia uniflora]